VQEKLSGRAGHSRNGGKAKGGAFQNNHICTVPLKAFKGSWKIRDVFAFVKGFETPLYIKQNAKLFISITY
jgi:hypothetical protein